MKFIAILMLATLSMGAFASDTSLVDSCRHAGLRKIYSRVEAEGFNISDADVYPCKVDNRIFSKVKTVWFCANVSDGEQIVVSTQKVMFKECI